MSPDPKDNQKTASEVSNTMTMNNVPIHLDEEGNPSSEESDNEMDEYNAYKPLAQDDMPNGCMHDSDTDDDNDEDDDEDSDNSGNDDGVNGFDDFAGFEEMETVSLSELEYGSCGEDVTGGINYDNLHCAGVDEDMVPSSSIQYPSPSVEDDEPAEAASEQIDMDDAQAELVRSAMVGFSLPSSSIPDWAKNISDDEWKTTLISTIQKKPDT